VKRAVLLSLALVACSEGTGGGPAPVERPDDTTPPPEQPPPEPTVKRTVIQRNPYGNVAAADNLLWDGDFEFRPAFQEQYGWLTGSGFSVSFALPPLVVGPRCKSGIKCAELAPGATILGIAVASKGHSLAVSFWSHPEDGSCAAADASLISQLDAVEGEKLEPVEESPDAEGWCRHEIIVAEMSAAPYLVIENVSAAPLVVDDAVILPVDAAEARSHRSARVWTAAEEERFGRLRESARRAREPRRLPPSAGERALEAKWKVMRR
jgi:hypothetical protein